LLGFPSDMSYHVGQQIRRGVCEESRQLRICEAPVPTCCRHHSGL